MLPLTRKFSKPLLNSTNRNLFHSSSFLKFGRKSGASALDAPPRPFSRKQLKRKARNRLRALEKRDPAKEKIKMAHFKKRVISPEVFDYLKQTKEQLWPAIDEALRPDGIVALESSDVKKSMKNPNPTRVLEKLRKIRLQSLEAVDNEERRQDFQKDSDSGVKDISQKVTANHAVPYKSSGISNSTAGIALVAFAKQGRKAEVEEMISLMNSQGMTMQLETYTGLIAAATKRGQHATAVKYFDDMIAGNLTPDAKAWTALINARARGRGPGFGAEAALEIADRLYKTGFPVTTPMYNCVLKAFIDEKKPQRANEIWAQMHELPIDLDKESFSIVLKLCTVTGQPERAFFYMDELRSLGVTPDDKVFLGLFRACAEAPHWVNGYQDIIFDAMASMEGAELPPTTEIYNTIIYAFGRAGDAAAAEFYFWEMREKGLRQDLVTYNSLLGALARAQQVGGPPYGIKGRWVRPPEKPMTVDQQAYADLGVHRVNKILADGLYISGESDRGSRNRGQLRDMIDDDDETAEAIFDNIRQEARLVRERRAQWERALEQRAKATAAAAALASSSKESSHQQQGLHTNTSASASASNALNTSNGGVVVATADSDDGDDSDADIISDEELRAFLGSASDDDDEEVDIDEMIKDDPEFAALWEQIQASGAAKLAMDEGSALDKAPGGRSKAQGRAVAAKSGATAAAQVEWGQGSGLGVRSQGLEVGSQRGLEDLLFGDVDGSQDADADVMEAEFSSQDGPTSFRSSSKNSLMPRSVADDGEGAEGAEFGEDASLAGVEGGLEAAAAPGGRKGGRRLSRPKITRSRRRVVDAELDNSESSIAAGAAADADHTGSESARQDDSVIESLSERDSEKQQSHGIRSRLSARRDISTRGWDEIDEIFAAAEDDEETQLRTAGVASPESRRAISKGMEAATAYMNKSKTFGASGQQQQRPQQQQEELDEFAELDSADADIQEVETALVGDSEELPAALFQDPFATTRQTNRRRREEERASKEAITSKGSAIADLLDAKISTDELKKELQLSEAAKAKGKKGRKEDTMDPAFDEFLELLSSGGPSQKREELDDEWDLVEFGRAPSPDYSKPLRVRQAHNIDRAGMVFQEISRMGLRPDATSLNSLLSVYSEALLFDEANAVLAGFQDYNIKPDTRTYRHLVRMYVRGRDLQAALRAKEEMAKKGLSPDSETYGLLIETLAHRDMIVESLQMLEEAAEKKLVLRDIHVRVLRNRCKNLNVRHPDMPPDPNAWVSRVKKVRRDMKHAPKGNVQEALSAIYS